MSVTELSTSATAAPAFSEHRQAADGEVAAGAGRGDPAELRLGRFVQPLWIKKVGRRPHVAKGGVCLKSDRYRTYMEPPPDQRAARQLDVVVVQRRARIAPVREPVDVDDPVEGAGGAGEQARVDAGRVVVAIFARGAGGRGVRE